MIIKDIETSRYTGVFKLDFLLESVRENQIIVFIINRVPRCNGIN